MKANKIGTKCQIMGKNRPYSEKKEKNYYLDDLKILFQINKLQVCLKFILFWYIFC